jgi:hypothetical protein
MAIWIILMPFGIHVCIMAIWEFSANLVYFDPFWYIYCVKKTLATLFETTNLSQE